MNSIERKEGERLKRTVVTAASLSYLAFHTCSKITDQDPFQVIALLISRLNTVISRESENFDLLINMGPIEANITYQPLIKRLTR